MINWLFKILPSDWKWSVAIKKIAYGVGKLFASGLTYGKAPALMTQFGIHVDPVSFQNAVAAMTMAGLVAIHDWARVRFKDSPISNYL